MIVKIRMPHRLDFHGVKIVLAWTNSFLILVVLVFLDI